MKTIFQGSMTLHFSDHVGSLGQAVFDFASADGIRGEVIVKDISVLAPREVRVKLEVRSIEKRMFPDSEAYLELIKTVIGGATKVSILKLGDIRSTLFRTLDQVTILKSAGGYHIGVDMDGYHYLIKMDDIQKVKRGFETFAEADIYLSQKLIDQ